MLVKMSIARTNPMAALTIAPMAKPNPAPTHAPILPLVSRPTAALHAIQLIAERSIQPNIQPEKANHAPREMEKRVTTQIILAKLTCQRVGGVPWGVIRIST